MFFHMPYGRLGAVVGGVVGMSVGQMRVVRGLLVVAGGMVLRRFPVVLGRVLVMLRCLGVVLGRFFRHGEALRLMLDTGSSGTRERRGCCLIIVFRQPRAASDERRVAPCRRSECPAGRPQARGLSVACAWAGPAWKRTCCYAPIVEALW